jgi:hypothetical protein
MNEKEIKLKYIKISDLIQDMFFLDFTESYEYLSVAFLIHFFSKTDGSPENFYYKMKMRNTKNIKRQKIGR